MRANIDDLQYELRMLLGADKLLQFFEEKEMGNSTNLLKGSIYMHSRNWYNFFSNESDNDAKVSEFITHDFDLSLYIKWKSALHTHVLHMKTARNNPNNIIDSKHLNEQPHIFVNDIVEIWKEWINKTRDRNIKESLQKAMDTATVEASDDYNNMLIKLK